MGHRASFRLKKVKESAIQKMQLGQTLHILDGLSNMIILKFKERNAHTAVARSVSYNFINLEHVWEF